MRQIKFRAWDKVQEKLYDKCWFDDSKVYVKDGWLPKTEEIELLQFTGLTDKNGKEIYEGDILSVGYPGRTNAKLSVVEWKQPQVRYSHEEPYEDLNGFVQFGTYKQVAVDDDKGNYAMHEGYFEVIGNIYQNPELLK